MRRDPGPAVALGLVVLMFVGWQVVHLIAGDNEAGEPLVPGIGDVVGAMKSFSNEWPGGWGVGRTDQGAPESWLGATLAFGYHASVTGLRMLGGFTLGALTGVVLAAAVSWSPRVRQIVHVPAHVSRMLPLLGLIPLFGLWFGNSSLGAVLFIAFTVFVQVFAFGINAIANVPVYFEQAARSLGASSVRSYVQVVLPAATPELGAGLSLSLALGWSAAISAEFNGQESGLGHVAYLAQYFTRTPTLALMAFVVIGFAAISFLAARAFLSRITQWAE